MAHNILKGIGNVIKAGIDGLKDTAKAGLRGAGNVIRAGANILGGDSNSTEARNLNNRDAVNRGAVDSMRLFTKDQDHQDKSIQRQAADFAKSA